MPYTPGPAELINLAGKALAIYYFIRNAPEDVQGLLQKFKYVATQLQYLSRVLELSGWQDYDEALELRKHLDEAQRYFARYQSLAEGTAGLVTRTCNIARLAVDQDKVNKIRADTDAHLAKMDRFKANVMLYGRRKLALEVVANFCALESVLSESCRTLGAFCVETQALVLCHCQLLIELKVLSERRSSLDSRTKLMLMLIPMRLASSLKRPMRFKWRGNYEEVDPN